MGGRGGSSGMRGSSAKSGGGARNEDYYQSQIDAMAKKYDAVRPYSDEEKKDFFFQIGSEPLPNKIYYSKLSPEEADKALAMDEKRLEHYNKYKGITINENMPKLEGTEKQIAYAESLRQKALTDLATQASAPFSDISKNKDRLVKAGEIKGTTFKSVSDAATTELKSNSVYKFYSTEKSAAKIIEDYKARSLEHDGKTFRKLMWRKK